MKDLTGRVARNLDHPQAAYRLALAQRAVDPYRGDPPTVRPMGDREHQPGQESVRGPRQRESLHEGLLRLAAEHFGAAAVGGQARARWR